MKNGGRLDVLLVLGLALAVATGPREATAQRVAVARWAERDGLQQSQVQGLALDPDGFLWVATRNGGLSRFDGTTFRAVGPEEGLTERVLGPLASSADGSLWIAGARLHLRRGERVHQILARRIDALAPAPSGGVLAGGPWGLARVFRMGSELRVRRLLDEPVAAVVASGASVLAGGPSGLYRLREDATARAERVMSGPVHSFLALAGDQVLAGLEGGLRLLTASGSSDVLPGQVSFRVNAMRADDRGRVWLGTDVGAFRLLPDLSAIELAPRDGLPAVRILELCVAPGGAVWLGGDGGGLYRFVPSRFAVVAGEAGLDELIALSLAEAPDGSLWIGTPRGGIAHLVDGTFTLFGPEHGLPRADRFRDLLFLPDGTLVAGFDGGLVLKAPGLERFRAVRTPAGVRATGLCASPAREGGRLGSPTPIWVSTSAGLFRFEDGRLRPEVVEGLTGRPLDTLAAGIGGDLLAAAGDRVFVIGPRNDVEELTTARRSRLGATIWHLAVATDGAVWAASIQGALRVQGKDVRVLDSSSGLPDDSVDAVLPALDGTVWLSTDRGLAHLSSEGQVLRVYGLADGLPAREGIVRAAHRDRAGRLWFGVVGAIVVHDATAEAYEPPPPRLHVERLHLPDRGREERETQADLSVIDFEDARGTAISYRLEPLERGFSSPLATRSVRWVDLPHGEYLFVARAVDRSGRPGPEVRARLRIPRLWHETPQVRALLAALGLALGAALPSALRAGSRVVARTRAHLTFLIREALAPEYEPIRGDPFSAREVPIAPSRAALVQGILSSIASAWSRQEVVLLVGPSGSGKAELLRELERRTDTLSMREDEELPQALSRLRARLPSLPEPPRASDVSRALSESGATLLILRHDRSPWSHESARQRLAVANELLGTAPGLSLVLARDLEASQLVAEEPQLASLARIVRVPSLSPREGGDFLEAVAGELARFEPGAADRASARVGGHPERLRAFGSALLTRLANRRSNRVRESDVNDVLQAWEEYPPAFLGVLWAARSPSERILLAALGTVDNGRGQLRALGQLAEELDRAGFQLGRVTIGALVDRLCEAELLGRQADRVWFREEIVARFVARHRPLTEERPSGAEVLGPWELLETVGTGGMGTIYRARRLDDRSEAAVKVVHAHLLNTPEMRRRFLREAEIVARFTHPGVVRVLERGESGGRSYIAMEYLPGSSLRDVLARFGPLPVSLAVRLGRDLARTAAALHEAGILHRDIKTANIVVLPDWRLKLLDFGLARRENATRVTETGHVAGTPDSMAPEQVRGEEPSPRADVWAVGICLYEMLTGNSPFNRFGTVATFKAILEEEPEPVSALRPSIPRALDDIVASALRKDVASRCPSAAALADALESALPSLPRPATLPSLETISRGPEPASDDPPAPVPGEA